MDPSKGKTVESFGSVAVCTKQRRIAELARKSPTMVLSTLAHHVDVEWLREAYRRTRKDGAVGVDGQTAADYEADLEENLRSLLERAKSGVYRAPPVRRVYIPKGNGKETRPLGIPTFEDKVLQRAVVMLLEPIYEQDFWNCSYGFRPGRNAHQALDALWRETMGMRGGWVIDLDIREFFDSLGHGHLKAILRQRVSDGVVLRLISKWLHAGVLEEGCLTYSETGSPQGGVISPLLANVYLHEVLDTWFEQMVRSRMRGCCALVRYADDAVLVFERHSDADRVMRVLAKRFEKHGLRLHPDKTRLVRFQPPTGGGSKGSDDDAGRGTFEFLGFSHFWAKSRKGSWVVKRKTAKSRFTRALRSLSQWCRRHRHWPVARQWRMLCRRLQGHYAYYGIIGNHRSLDHLRWRTERIWRKWLSRRSWAAMPWERFQRLLARYPLARARLSTSQRNRGPIT
jgi:RNA-directed DNA polymerase